MTTPLRELVERLAELYEKAQPIDGEGSRNTTHDGAFIYAIRNAFPAIRDFILSATAGEVDNWPVMCKRLADERNAAEAERDAALLSAESLRQRCENYQASHDWAIDTLAKALDVEADKVKAVEFYARLAAEAIESLRADAERYRWLRNPRESIEDGKPFIVTRHHGGSGFSALDEELADRQIDAAIAGGEKQ